MKKNDPPVTVEETFNATIKDVWEAITNIELMRKWYFDNIPSFIPEVGFEIQFNVTNEGRNFLHIWKITEVVPEKIIAYSWNYKEYPGEGLVVFDLSEQNGLTKLKLTNEIIESFPDDLPEFKRESCIAGWEYFIKGNLKNLLDTYNE